MKLLQCLFIHDITILSYTVMARKEEGDRNYNFIILHVKLLTIGVVKYYIKYS